MFVWNSVHLTHTDAKLFPDPLIDFVSLYHEPYSIYVAFGRRRRRRSLTQIREKQHFSNILQKLYEWLDNLMTGYVDERISDGASNRSKGRQTETMEDDLKKVAGPLWLRTAKQRNEWKALEEAFVERQAVKRGEKTECRE
ncbi:hypothetical protein EVAR_34533_1 [Eumeta japonica]|uniref:Uncharacterized protein n=1 Tax=Eumeta variegata TaxID=151549 RepID=A0A4C1X490_EUMVA|nr:hypothetical protein EVAR_34533_1 [Eumeta japonica]